MNSDSAEYDFKARLCYPVIDDTGYSHTTQSSAIDTQSTELAMHNTDGLHTDEPLKE